MITTSDPNVEPDVDSRADNGLEPAHVRGARSRAATGLAGIAIVACAAGIYVQSTDARHQTQLDSDRRAVVSAARSEVVALTTVSAKTSDADVARLLDGATADFKTQFQQQASAFTAALREAKVTSTGSIASAGLQSMAKGQAVVLVAATGTVKNAASAKGEARNYRFKLTMTKSDGRWLVAGMEFVA